MKDRLAQVLVWLTIIGLIGGVVAALSALGLLLWRATQETTAEPLATVQEVDLSQPEGSAAADAVPDDAAPAEVEAPSDAGSPGACSFPSKPGPQERLVRLPIEQFRAADVLDLFPTAKKLALELEAQSELRYIQADHTRHGRVDLATEQVEYVFEFQHFSPTGARTGLVEVTAACYGLHAKLRREVQIYRTPQHDLVPDPRCSSAQAWQAAVRHGVPDGALANMIYHDDDSNVRGSAIVWTITVDDQPNHRREVDGRTCAVLRTYESGAPAQVVSPRGSSSAPRSIP